MNATNSWRVHDKKSNLIQKIEVLKKDGIIIKRTMIDD